MEIAFVSANKIHIEIEKKQEGFLAKVLTLLTDKPSKFIATMLIGNNIALVIYGLFMGDVLMEWFQSLLPSDYQLVNALLTDFNLLSQTVISTLVILLTAEFLPKVFFQIYANALIKIFAVPAYFFYILFAAISWFVIKVSDFILRVFLKTDGDEVQLSFTKLELGDYINEQMETVEEEDDGDESDDLDVHTVINKEGKDLGLMFKLGDPTDVKHPDFDDIGVEELPLEPAKPTGSASIRRRKGKGKKRE